MKKECALKTGFLLVTICLVFLLSSCSEQYPTGKDTVLSVGNGRFQILHGITYSLFTFDNSTSTADDVQEYYDDTKGAKLYLICESGYIVVDYKAETYKQYPRIEDCKQEDQAVFQDDSKFTAFGQP
jgi:hypothetical protein